MSLHDELLDTARYLLRRNQSRPSPADVRRSISTAYYAVFHRLIDDSVQHLVPAADQQAVLGRAFAPTDMKRVCQLILKSPLPGHAASLLGGPVPPELKGIAEAFLELQELRHDADYNKDRNFDRSEGRDAIGRVERSLRGWELIHTTPVARAFLVMLLLGERWNR